MKPNAPRKTMQEQEPDKQPESENGTAGRVNSNAFLGSPMSLYQVFIERSLFVLAASPRHAEDIALLYEREEIGNTFGPDMISASLITKKSQIPEEWKSSIPYGWNEQTTCDELVET